MLIRDEYGHFKSVVKTGWWAHKYNLRTWTNPWEYVNTFSTDHKYPRLFGLIKRK